MGIYRKSPMQTDAYTAQRKAYRDGFSFTSRKIRSEIFTFPTWRNDGIYSLPIEMGRREFHHSHVKFRFVILRVAKTHLPQ